jgi:hypothetical protein
MQKSHLRSKTGIALSMLLCASLFTTEARPEFGDYVGCKWIKYGTTTDALLSALGVFLLLSYLRLETKDKKTVMTSEDFKNEMKKAGIIDYPGLAFDMWDDWWVGIKEQIPYLYVSGSKIIVPRDEHLVREAWENNQLMQNYIKEGRRARGVMGHLQAYLRDIFGALKFLKEGNETLGFFGITTPLTPAPSNTHIIKIDAGNNATISVGAVQQTNS